jgi:hypothetical protein
MKTAAEIAQHLGETIANIYLHPAMYGETVAGVEQALWIYHRMWAYATEQDSEYFRALTDAGDAADSGSALFEGAYRNSHPGAQDHEVLAFVLKYWAMVTTHLGIAVPAAHSDPRHSFLRG